MILILMKSEKMSQLRTAERSATERSVFHRDFLGAHRYTTVGGTARPAGGVLRTAGVCRGQPKGDATLPLRCIRTYPCVYFPLGEPLKSRASPGEKSFSRSRQLRAVAKVRCRYGC